MRLLTLSTPSRSLTVIYPIALSVGGAVNIWINHVAKGSWDFYPVAQIVWVLCSFFVVTTCSTMKRLVIAVIFLLFLDSFVDMCAMGDPFWWGTPPRLIEWIWQTKPHGERLVSAYWLCMWGFQVPLRCLAMARAVSGSWGRQFGIIALGLNLLWFTSVQDILYYFVWLGLYSSHIQYFRYLPPEGFWNLWNMLLLRVPIGVTIGALLIRAGYRAKRSLLTTVLMWCAVLGIALNALTFMTFLFTPKPHVDPMQPNRSTEWRPRHAARRFGSQGGAAIGELMR